MKRSYARFAVAMRLRLPRAGSALAVTATLVALAACGGEDGGPPRIAESFGSDVTEPPVLVDEGESPADGAASGSSSEIASGDTGAPLADQRPALLDEQAHLDEGSTGAAVEQLQTALVALGFDPGSVDGVLGPKTTTAVGAFQRAEGLTANGTASVATLRAINEAIRGIE